MDSINAKLLIFDLDGTLADTIPAITDGMNLALDECGYPRCNNDHLRRSIGNGARMLCRRMLPVELYDDDQAVDQLLRIYDRAYGLTYMNTTENYPGISRVISELKRRGYQLAVLSNKQDPYVRDLISALFPDGEFSIAMGDLPGRARKPDPDTALKICSSLGISPDETVMIGDGETDVMVAKNAGFASGIAVSWGYRPIHLLREAGADVIIHSAEQLLDLFPQI